LDESGNIESEGNRLAFRFTALFKFLGSTSQPISWLQLNQAIDNSLIKTCRFVFCFSRKSSDTHGHDDVAVAVGLIGERAHLPGGLFVLQFDADRAIGRGAEKIQHVAGIETDGDRLAFEFLLNGFFGFAVLRARCGYFDALA